MKFNIFLTSFFIILGFMLCTAIAIIINPHLFTNFFSTSPTKLFYDVEHYSNLAIYPSCNAFYPLWPWLANKFGTIQTVNNAAFSFRIFGSFLSLVSIPLFLWVLQKNIQSYKIATLAVALYVVNPLSIFRMIGYTEGIFSVLSLILLIILSNLKISTKPYIKFVYSLLGVFLLSLLLSLTRPFLIQAIISAILALVSILLINNLNNSIENIKVLKIYGITTFIVCLGALVGYCIYGYYCFEVRRDFFAPFHDQKIWGKEIGFYPQILFLPLNYADFISIYTPVIATITAWLIAVSTNMRKLIFLIPNFWQWLLLFGYPPAFLAFYGIDFKNANFSDHSNNLKDISLNQQAPNLSNNYAFWFCIYFALTHVLIIIFSDQKLTSLRRFIFGTPYFFFAIAYISQCFPERQVSKLLLLLIGLSSIWLVQYWLDYANGIWIG